MSWLSVRSLQWTNMVRFGNRMQKLGSDRLTKQVFMWDREQGHNRWSTDIKMIFSTLDLQYVYDQNILCNEDLLQQRLQNYENMQWRDEIAHKPKLRLYNKIKTDLKVEDYVKINLNRVERSCLAQLRAGILKINIELGRMARLKVEERLCPICNCGAVEDELHFVFICDAYHNIRFKFLKTLQDRNLITFIDISDEGKPIQTLKLISENFPKLLTKYILDCMDIRKNRMYVTKT